MTDAPETIWAVHWNTEGAVINGAWADTIRHFCGGIEYRRADLVAPAPAKVTLQEAAKDEIAAVCVGCGKPANGMCWTDCGMSLCGAPICDTCRHIDETHGWSHGPRAPAKVTLGFLRPIWKDHSGEWHGPKVERWSIPEDQMVTFFNAALRAIAGEKP